MITRKHGFKHQATTLSSTAAQLPPPLCFTVPAASYHQTGSLQTGGHLPFGPAKPRLMMDPSDPSTWQRPYEFPA